MRHRGRRTCRDTQGGGRRTGGTGRVARPRVARAVGLGLAAALALPFQVAVPAAAAPAAASAVTAVPVAAATAAKKKAKKKLPAGPKVRAIPGRTTASLRWNATKGAKRYLVELTTASTFGTGTTRRITTRSTTIRVTGLRKSTSYKIRVTADRGVRTRPSRTITTRTSSAAATQVVTRVAPVGSSSVRVSWSRPTRATSVSVVLAPTAAELNDSEVRVKINGISAWTTSRVVKIPARLRTRIGPTSGNPVYARVTAYNSEHSWTHSGTVTTYLRSPAVHGTQADRTKVATYNVQLPSITQNITGRRWEDRRRAVARAIARGRPDVVGLQETDMSFVEAGVRQYQDVERLVAPYGYAWATTHEQIDEVRARDPRRSLGAHIVYRTSTTELLDSGLVSLRDAAAAYDPKVAWVDGDGKPDPDRYATWALFRDRDSGREFYAASAHLKNGETPDVKALRKVSAGGLDLFLWRLARSQGRPTAPIVVLADLNSDNGRHPEGAHEHFIAKGYASGASAPVRKNLKVATVNSHALGYPSRPTVATHAGMRIDHVLVRRGGGVARYENQVVLTPSGTFDERYRGSDHNLQLAEISLAPR